MSPLSSLPFDWHSYQTAFGPRTDSGELWQITVAADWAPIRRFADQMIHQPAAVYGDLLPLFAASDLNIFNVEAVLCDSSLAEIPKDGPGLRADKRSGESLRAAHCHLACLANNHAMDYGVQGLGQMLETLDALGIPHVGAGLTEETVQAASFHTIKDVRVAVINCAEGEAGRAQRGGAGVLGLDTAAEILRIQALRRSNLADVIVVIFHGGREHVPVPPPYVVTAMRQLADGGADAVIAHHPHVPQGVEIYNGVPIAYSLGNFVFWQENNSYFRHVGYLAHLDFAGKQLQALRLTPYRITAEGLRQMNEAEKTSFSETMQRASAPLHSMRDVEACWAAFTDRQSLANFSQFATERLAKIDDHSMMAAAAMQLHNRFFTPAHSQMLCELLERHATGRHGSAPPDAARLVDFWLEHSLDD